MNALKQKDNIITYERTKRKMPLEESSQETKENGDGKNGNIEKKASDKYESTNSILKVATALLGIIVIICGATSYVVGNIVSQGKDIEYLKEQATQTANDIININTNIEQIGEISDNNYETFLELSAASKEEEAQSIVFQDLYQVKTETIRNEEYLAQPIWDDESIIASDIDGDIVYTAEDLYDTLILTSYEQNGNEVYFYGRFNENNHWNGKCILNVYDGDKLVSVFEGVYNDGELFKYRRISQGNDSTWIVNNRKRQGDYNSGETSVYRRTDDFIKGFTSENLKETQILTIDKFLNSIDKKLVSYYHGNTSNNLYNDSTGSSYLVKYKDDGDVDYLYVGRMKDGYPNDGTGNAWSVGWGYADDGYHYFKGEFYNNKHKETEESLEVMTQEKIDEKVDKNRFNCPLTGLVE